MKNIGFIGLGTMGFPMSHNLVKAGYDLIVYNRTVSKAENLKKLGNVTIASSPADVARLSDVVITILTNDHALEEVMNGKDGVMEGVHPGLIVIDSSTVSPNIVTTLANNFSNKGAYMLDAPVTGSEPQAVEGQLAFMVGGKRDIRAVSPSV